KTPTGAWVFKEPKYGLADAEGDISSKDDKKQPGVRGLLNAINSIYAESEADLVPLGEKRNMGDYGLEEGRSLYRIQVEHAVEAGIDALERGPGQGAAAFRQRRRDSAPYQHAPGETAGQGVLRRPQEDRRRPGTDHAESDRDGLLRRRGAGEQGRKEGRQEDR